MICEVTCLTILIKGSWPIFFFLGVEVILHKHGLLLSQRWYIKDLFVCTKMIDAKPIATSLATSLILTLHSSTTLSDPIEF